MTPHPDKLTIYGDTVSGNCLKVRWVLERLGIQRLMLASGRAGAKWN